MSLSCVHVSIDCFFFFCYHKCVVWSRVLFAHHYWMTSENWWMNREWFYKDQSEHMDKTKLFNLLLNAHSLTALFPFSLALLVFLPLFFVMFISSVFWGGVQASSVDLMPNLLLCLIVRLRISPFVIQFNYWKTRSAAVELRQSASWHGSSLTRDVAGCGINCCSWASAVFSSPL